MRKLVLTLAAFAAFGMALPVASNPAEAREVVIIKKRHYDRGLHVGDWRRRHDRDRGWRHRDHDRPHGPAIIIR